MSELPIVPMAQWVGQQGSEAPATGSNPEFTDIFNFINTTWSFLGLFFYSYKIIVLAGFASVVYEIKC